MLTDLLDAALSAPKRVFDALDRDQIDSRRASLRGDRAMIEIRGVQRPDGAQYGAALVQALQQLPGVSWAVVNAPLSRVVVALAPPPAPTLPELVALVDRVEHEHHIGDEPADRAQSVDQALGALALNVAGLVGAAVGAMLGYTPLPAELAAVVTAAEAQPRVREVLEEVLGRCATDLGLAMLSAAGQGLAGGWFGLGVDAAQRTGMLGAARAALGGWQAQEGELLADPTRAGAELVVVERKQAESCGEYLDKGSPILVEGRLQTREWEAKDGGKRTVIEVVAERVQFMGRGRAAAPATVPASAEPFAEDAGSGNDDVPF